MRTKLEAMEKKEKKRKENIFFNYDEWKQDQKCMDPITYKFAISGEVVQN